MISAYRHDRPISIHAPREGGDRTDTRHQQLLRISIHAPREGGDAVLCISTAQYHKISIHAPREGGDGL